MIETTCTDCTKPIKMEERMCQERDGLSRLCEECKALRAKHGIHPEVISPPALGNYRTTVELQWMITPEDLRYRAFGDVEADFARRSLFAIRSALGLIAGCGHSRTPIGHYHLRDESHPDGLKRCSGPAADEQRAPGWVYAYHVALNRLAGLVCELNQSMDIPEIDLSEVCNALAVGCRMGWPVDEQLRSLVVASEDSGMPMSEEEAERRLRGYGVIS